MGWYGWYRQRSSIRWEVKYNGYGWTDELVKRQADWDKTKGEKLNTIPLEFKNVLITETKLVTLQSEFELAKKWIIEKEQMIQDTCNIEVKLHTMRLLSNINRLNMLKKQ